jgi:hypothetical protein
MLGREFNLIGQETVGVGGFAKGLRTIPVALKLADVILKHAPQAQLLNFTNPAGMITEALLSQRPELNTIGLCNVPWNIKNEISTTLDKPFKSLDLDYIGLNHLSWVRGLRFDIFHPPEVGPRDEVLLMPGQRFRVCEIGVTSLTREGGEPLAVKHFRLDKEGEVAGTSVPGALQLGHDPVLRAWSLASEL